MFLISIPHDCFFWWKWQWARTCFFVCANTKTSPRCAYKENKKEHWQETTCNRGPIKCEDMQSRGPGGLQRQGRKISKKNNSVKQSEGVWLFCSGDHSSSCCCCCCCWTNQKWALQKFDFRSEEKVQVQKHLQYIICKRITKIHFLLDYCWSFLRWQLPSIT